MKDEDKTEFQKFISDLTAPKKKSWSDRIFDWIFTGLGTTTLGRAVLDDLTRANGLPDTGSPREVRMFWAIIHCKQHLCRAVRMGRRRLSCHPPCVDSCVFNPPHRNGCGRELPLTDSIV